MSALAFAHDSAGQLHLVLLETPASHDPGLCMATWLDGLMGERGRPLAVFECRHGHLPHDRTITCTCWQPEGGLTDAP